MFIKRSRNKMRTIRHSRLRSKVVGTTMCPRMAVYKSLKNISVQFIDDMSGNTLVSASSLERSVRDSLSSRSNVDAAKTVGKLAAEKALAKGITKVVFDRGGHKYHGCVKALAESARENGLQF